jgi:hypothetical protein
VWTEDAGGILESYLYDGDGRLARVNTHSGTSHKGTIFAYDGEQMVAAWMEAGSGWDQIWQAVWAPSQDQLAEFHNFATGRSTVVIPDHRNSVAATIDMDTHSVYRLA